MVFGIILGVVVLLLAINFLRLAGKGLSKPAAIFAKIIKDISSGFGLIGRINLKNKNLFNIIREILYSFSIVLFLIMALSGFVYPLFWQAMDGSVLFIHLLTAPLFVLAVTLSIALLAHKLQFNSNDYRYFTGSASTAVNRFEFWKKIYFWLFAVAIIFNIASIVLAMYPAFGTAGQEWLLDIHRYSALALLVITINYLTLRYALKK